MASPAHLSVQNRAPEASLQKVRLAEATIMAYTISLKFRKLPIENRFTSCQFVKRHIVTTKLRSSLLTSEWPPRPDRDIASKNLKIQHWQLSTGPSPSLPLLSVYDTHTEDRATYSSQTKDTDPVYHASHPIPSRPTTLQHNHHSQTHRAFDDRQTA